MHHVTAEEAQILLDYPCLIAALHAAHAADLHPDTYRDIREDQNANAFV